MARDRSEVHVLGGLWRSFARQALWCLCVLFHFSNLTFLFVVHARNRHDLRSHVPVGNTTLRWRPCRFVTRSAINADNKGTSLLVPFADDWTDLVLRAHGEASAHLRPPATWQEVSLIVAVDRRRQ